MDRRIDRALQCISKLFPTIFQIIVIYTIHFFINRRRIDFWCRHIYISAAFETHKNTILLVRFLAVAVIRAGVIYTVLMTGIKPVSEIMVGVIELQVRLQAVFLVCLLVRRIVCVIAEERILCVPVHMLIDVLLVRIVVVSYLQIFSNFTTHEHRSRASIDLDGLCLVNIHKGKTADNRA